MEPRKANYYGATESHSGCWGTGALRELESCFVCRNRQIDLVDLFELDKLLIQANSGGTYESVPFPADLKKIDVGDYAGDFRKIETELGWRPTVSLREGLARTVDFCRKNRSEYWESATT